MNLLNQKGNEAKKKKKFFSNVCPRINLLLFVSFALIAFQLERLIGIAGIRKSLCEREKKGGDGKKNGQSNKIRLGNGRNKFRNRVCRAHLKKADSFVRSFKSQEIDPDGYIYVIESQILNLRLAKLLTGHRTFRQNSI